MDVLRESRQAAPNRQKDRTSPKSCPQSQTQTASASLLNLIEPCLMKRLLILANA